MPDFLSTGHGTEAHCFEGAGICVGGRREGRSPEGGPPTSSCLASEIILLSTPTGDGSDFWRDSPPKMGAVEGCLRGLRLLRSSLEPKKPIDCG